MDEGVDGALQALAVDGEGAVQVVGDLVKCSGGQTLNALRVVTLASMI